MASPNLSAAAVPLEISDFSLYRELKYVESPSNVKLGEGTYGVVYLQATPDPLTGTTKDVVFKVSKRPGDIAQVDLNEVSSMIRISHPNVAKVLYCHFTPTGQFAYAMEPANGNLWEEIQKGLTEEQIISYVYQIIAGVGYCLQRDIIHRDLKPQNVLVTQDGSLQIADFGLVENLSCVAQRQLDTNVATMWWRSPDVILGNDTYGADLDIWSVGTMIYNITRARYIFNGKDLHDTVDAIFEALGDPKGDDREYLQLLPKWNSVMGADYQFTHPGDGKVPFPTMKANFPGLWELCMGMLKYNPRKRMTLDRAIMHPVFDGIRKTSDILPPASCFSSLLMRDRPLRGLENTEDSRLAVQGAHKYAFKELFNVAMGVMTFFQHDTNSTFSRLTKAYGHFVFLLSQSNSLVGTQTAVMGCMYLVVQYHYGEYADPFKFGLEEAKIVLEALKADLLVSTPGDYIRESETEEQYSPTYDGGAMISCLALFFFSLWPGYQNLSALEISQMCLLARSTVAYPVDVPAEAVTRYLDATNWIYEKWSELVANIELDVPTPGNPGINPVFKGFPQLAKTRPIHLV